MEYPVLRLCFTEQGGIFSLPPNIQDGSLTTVSELHSEGGPISGIYNLLMDLIMFRNDLNVSVTIRKSIGMDGGCLEAMDKNLTDMPIAYYDYPTNIAYEKVFPFQILFESPAGMLHTYRKTNSGGKKKYADLFKNSIKSFTPGLWTAIFFSLLLLAIFLKLRVMLLQKMMTRRKVSFKNDRIQERIKETREPFYQVFCLFFMQDEFDYDMAFPRVISLLVSLSSIVFIPGYFCNLLSTEMVVVEKPVTYCIVCYNSFREKS